VGFNKAFELCSSIASPTGLDDNIDLEEK